MTGLPDSHPLECVIPDGVLIKAGPPDDENLLLETCRGVEINTFKKSASSWSLTRISCYTLVTECRGRYSSSSALFLEVPAFKPRPGYQKFKSVFVLTQPTTYIFMNHKYIYYLTSLTCFGLLSHLQRCNLVMKRSLQSISYQTV